jgi:hypothetical protein
LHHSSLQRIYTTYDPDTGSDNKQSTAINNNNSNPSKLQPNKVLNIINNLIRVGQKKANANPTISTGLNRLKRASSSTQFQNNKARLKFTSSLSNAAASNTSPGDLVNKPKLSTTSNIETDVKRLSLSDDKFIDKFENTLYSSKNSGLIFVPNCSQGNHHQQQQLIDDDRLYEKLTTNKISTGFMSTSTENFLNGSVNETKTTSIANLNLKTKRKCQTKIEQAREREKTQWAHSVSNQQKEDRNWQYLFHCHQTWHQKFKS